MSETTEKERASTIFNGLLTRGQLKEETGWCDRTVVKFETSGMQFMDVAGKRYYAVEDVRAWVLKQRHRDTPRGPGRPRKAA